MSASIPDPKLRNLAEFKSALTELDDQLIMDRFYYGRPAVALTPEQESSLRREISRRFDVAMRDVLVTGSAKIGFTTVSKEGRPIFSPFGDTSDIDVVIISQPLFVKMWKETCNFWSEDVEWRDQASFRRYLQRGWLRPDKLPRHTDFPEQAEWFEFFRGMTASGRFGPYAISAGVYYDEHFWERYVSRSIKESRDSLRAI